VNDERPAPLVAADVDLRGYGYMPFFGDRCFNSTTWIEASDVARIAALRLWWQAWAHQVPASSLPANDKALAQYAQVTLAVWKRIKDQALRGFIECSDGRLYHDELSAWAVDAWGKRVADRDRKARWRAGRHPSRHADGDGDTTRTETGTERGRDADVPSEAKLSEVKRSEANIKNREVQRTPRISARATEVKGAVLKNGNVKGQDWNDRAWVTATAQTLGIERRNGESDTDFKDRTYDALQAKIRAATAHIRGISP
jgi:hypothetical protein